MTAHLPCSARTGQEGGPTAFGGGAASLPADVGDNTHMPPISPGRDVSVTRMALSELLFVIGTQDSNAKDGQNA
jgi:hypothetical protein